jgi:hypothetical protein
MAEKQMNHLEQTLSEWLEWKGYFLRKNVKVGALAHGGHAGELDILALHPRTGHLLHIECSIDSNDWKTREKKFQRKFRTGLERAITEVFSWLPKETRLEQWAILWASDANRKEIGGGKIIPIWSVFETITDEIREFDAAHKSNQLIPETYPILRTIQLVTRWKL